jgi:hypothetical protein
VSFHASENGRHTVKPSRENHSIRAAREVVAAFVRLRGLKRGLHDAAGTLGVSESWARKIHYGEATAVSTEVAERAAAARGDVLRARLEAARREVETLEGALHGHGLAHADALRVSARGLVR